MKDTELTYQDKTEWGDGPWQQEPDKQQWTSASGLPCLLARGPGGGLCGYVGVPKGHPWFEKDYGAVKPDPDVHGGLTYANHCQGMICLEVEEGEDQNIWWLGFDCAHAGDLSPAFQKIGTHDEYRDVAYVRHETENLAKQTVACTPL